MVDFRSGRMHRHWSNAIDYLSAKEAIEPALKIGEGREWQF
jgi:hypothetical protein